MVPRFMRKLIHKNTRDYVDFKGNGGGMSGTGGARDVGVLQEQMNENIAIVYKISNFPRGDLRYGRQPPDFLMQVN